MDNSVPVEETDSLDVSTPSATEPLPVLAFGPFHFDLRRRLLLKGNQVVDLQRRQGAALALFTMRAGEIVTREELIEALWGNLIVEYDKSLRPMINRLRRALGDSARRPRYLETVRGTGYRFLGVVTRVDPSEIRHLVDAVDDHQLDRDRAKRSARSEVSDEETLYLIDSADESLAPSDPARTPRESQTRRAFWPAAVRPGLRGFLLGLVAVVLVLTSVVISRSLVGGADAVEAVVAVAGPRLEVMPFESVGSFDPDEEPLIEGLALDLAAAITRRGGDRLQVVLPQFQTSKTPPKGGRAVAAHRLQGTLSRDTEGVLVRFSLIEEGSGNVAWSERSRAPELFELTPWRDALIDGVLDRVGVEGEVSRGASFHSSTPRDILLRARYHDHRGSWEDFDAIEVLCTRGLDRFPGDPNLLGFLARTDLRRWAGSLDPDYIESARTHASQALLRDPDEHRSLLVQANIALFVDREPQIAHRLLDRSRELDPRDPGLQLEWMNYLLSRFELAEAVEVAERAGAANPLNGIVQSEVDWLLYGARDFERVAARSLDSIELVPDLASARLVRVLALMELDRSEEAAATIDGLLRLRGTPGQDRQGAVEAAEQGAFRPFWTVWLQQLHRDYEIDVVYPAHFVMAYTALGDVEMALRWLEESWNSKTAWFGPLLSYPVLDPLRNEPRFVEFLELSARMYDLESPPQTALGR